MVIPFTVGRMGNFLFQAAAAIAYARKHGLEFTMPKEPWPPRGDPVYLPHLVNPNYDPSEDHVTVREKVFHYHEIDFNEAWRNGSIVLEGYWQTEKYFKHLRPEILKLFGFRWELNPGVVSVHVRRTDYLKWKNKHPRVPKRWIEAAMAQFNGFNFIFFSDDIPWCKQEFGRRKDCCFSIGNSEVEDLQRMSSCEHHICSASTYSWWAMYLNQNPHKRAIFPKLWFMPGWGGHDTKDLIPDWCERL